MNMPKRFFDPLLLIFNPYGVALADTNRKRILWIDASWLARRSGV